MAIAANKIAGVRAANITDREFAKLSREHNDANVVALSARFVPVQTNEEILDAFLGTEFGGARHAGRVAKITAAEK
jgi:ribose 5-phosphate isomerase B